MNFTNIKDRFFKVFLKKDDYDLECKMIDIEFSGG